MMLRRLAAILVVLSLAGLMAGCGDKWLTGKGKEKEQEPNEEEPSESISVGMQDSTYRVMDSDLNPSGNPDSSASNHPINQ